MESIHIQPLGQVGCEIRLQGLTIYIDPYLSNSVQEYEDESLIRLVPVPIKPEDITNADYVLITHEHRDHCDDQTLNLIAENSPQCIFIGPPSVCERLYLFGIPDKRIRCIKQEKIKLTEYICIDVVPSAHPEILKHPEGGWQAVGYVLNISGCMIYHAGDTSLTDELLGYLKMIGNIDIAMLPVNECNYMRQKQGIIGNMTVREAFYLADLLGAKVMMPTHWDMFEQNQVFKEEIDIIYKNTHPKFKLRFGPVSI